MLSRIKINGLRVFNLLIITVVIFTSANMCLWKKKGRIIEGDVIGYYSFLPAAIIHKDLTFSFIDKNEISENEIYWPLKSPTGKYVIKTTIGLSILYSPFFLIANYIAPFTKYKADGFTQPYKQLLVLSSIFYLSFGLFYLRKFLKQYFNDYIIGITMLCIVFGTNLLIYSTLHSTYSHIYSFFLFSAFLFFSKKWHESPTIRNSILIGVLIGLITLIRPTNIIITLIFIFFDITSLKKFKDRINFFLQKYKHILIIFLFAFLIWLPQLIYWKFQTGQFLFFSYPNERFFFNSPNIINNLFSYRNGWLVYTPIMIFAIIGILFMVRKGNRSLLVPISLFLIINIYLISSWWCWWYTGYGNRPYIESYSILAIPFAFFLSEVKKINRITFVIIIHFIFLLISLNILQSYQYKKGIIHYDSMTKDAYFEAFCKTEGTFENYDARNSPNHYNARLGLNENIYYKKLYFCGAERLDSSKENFVSEIDETSIFQNALNRNDKESYSGKFSIKLDANDPFGFGHTITDVKYEDKFKITAWILDKSGAGNGCLVCSSIQPGLFQVSGNKVIKESKDGWKKIELKVTMPYLENKTVKISVMNTSISPIYVDNFIIRRDKIIAKDESY